MFSTLATMGFASHVIGNIFHECCKQHAFGESTIDGNLEKLAEKIYLYYKDNKQITSKLQGKLTKERVKTSKGWLKLKAKAAQTRHLAPFALALAREHLEPRRIAICQLLCTFHAMLDEEGMFLSEEAKIRMPILGQRMCGLYAQLSSAALAQGSRGWTMTPKVHLMMHILEWLAPCCVQCSRV